MIAAPFPALAPALRNTMARLRPVKTPKKKKYAQRLRLASQITSICAAAVAIYANTHMTPQPYHTSILRGRAWVQELLDGNPRRIHDILGVRKHVFVTLAESLRLHGGLSDTKHVDVEEQLAIFLYTVVRNDSNRGIAERFQRSGDTISKYVSEPI